MNKQVKSTADVKPKAKRPTLGDALRHGVEIEKQAMGMTPDKFAAAEAVLSEIPGGLGAHPSSTFNVESEDTAGEIMIPIDKIESNPLNARRRYKFDVIKARADSIAREGQLEAVKVVANLEKPGHFILIDGEYRKRALSSLGRHEIRCRILLIESRIDLYRLSWLYNDQREGQTAIDNAIAWQVLLENEEVKDQTEISEMTGISIANVSKTLALLKLPSNILSVFDENEGALELGSGYELYQHYKKKDESAAMELARKIINDAMSYRDVVEYRRRVETETPRKTREVSRQYKIKLPDGVQIGTLKDFDSGKVALEAKIDDPRKREELVDMLKRHFRLDADLASS